MGWELDVKRRPVNGGWKIARKRKATAVRDWLVLGWGEPNTFFFPQTFSRLKLWIKHFFFKYNKGSIKKKNPHPDGCLQLAHTSLSTRQPPVGPVLAQGDLDHQCQQQHLHHGSAVRLHWEAVAQEDREEVEEAQVVMNSDVAAASFFPQFYGSETKDCGN